MASESSFVGFFYNLIGIWLLLGLSILSTYLAYVKKSIKLMSLSLLLSLPNVLFVLFVELEAYMNLMLVWFILQLTMAYLLIKH